MGLLMLCVSRGAFTEAGVSLLELTVSLSMEIPEQVLLRLHSQLSSDRVVLQGLQERGLTLLLLPGLWAGLFDHHSGLVKWRELQGLFPNKCVHPGLSLLERDLEVPLSSQLSVLPHVHLSQSPSSVLPPLCLQTLRLGLREGCHSSNFSVLHLPAEGPSSVPRGPAPLIHSHCSVSDTAPLSLPSPNFPPLTFSHCLNIFLLL